MKQFKKLICMCIILIFVACPIVMAATVQTTRVIPEDNQYFELAAVEVKEVEGKNKQVIMELWGYNIEFKRNGRKIFI